MPNSLDNLAKFVLFCQQRGIYCDTDFVDTVFDDYNQLIFAQTYNLEHLEKIAPLQKDSFVLVLESLQQKIINGQASQSLHGHVVAAIASKTAKSLINSVQTLYVGASVNPTYRKLFEQDSYEIVNTMMGGQDATVIQTTIGWSDHNYFFRKIADGYKDKLDKISAFVVDSAGNNGKLGAGIFSQPHQKHNAVCHEPPLIVHVGAAKTSENGWEVEGYSSATGPTFLAPISQNIWAKMAVDSNKEPLEDTSFAAPFASGVLAALNRRFGEYLTKEHILYALIATCDKVETVAPYQNKTPQRANLNYITNFAGISFDPEYAGAGVINYNNAFKLLAHMVDIGQKDHETIGRSFATRVESVTQDGKALPSSYKNGSYIYELEMPEGICLKTNIIAQFENNYGSLKLVSPTGTEIPLAASRLKIEDIRKNKETAAATTHAFTGEQMQGKWQIISTTPITRLQLNSHNFPEHDLVKSLSAKELLVKELPDLSNAVELSALRNSFTDKIKKNRPTKGLTIAGVKPPMADDEIISLLKNSGEAIERRTSTFTKVQYTASNTELSAYNYSNQFYQNVYDLNLCKLAYKTHINAAKEYLAQGRYLEAGNNYSMAAHNIRDYKGSTAKGGHSLHEKSVIAYSRALKTFEKGGYTDLAYFESENLYSALTRAVDDLRNINNPGRAYNFYKRMLQVQEKAVQLSFEMQGKISHDAVRIEEDQYGYTRNQKIATDNLQQCVFIAVKNTDINYSGSTHYSFGTDLTSVDKFLDGFPKGNVICRLAGSRYTGDIRSRENLISIVRHIQDRNIKILSADVWGGPDGPSAIIFDPVLFEMSEGVSLKINRNTYAANAIVSIFDDPNRLSKQFDLAQSQFHAPILMSCEKLERYNSVVAGKDLVELERSLKQANYTERGRLSYMISHLTREVDLAQGSYINSFNSVVDTLLKNSFKIDPKNIEMGISALKKLPFYIGENSEIANQPVLDIISKKLFKVRNNEAVLDLSAIDKIKLTEDIYDKLAKKLLNFADKVNSQHNIITRF